MKNIVKGMAKLVLALGLGVFFLAHAAGPGTDGPRKEAVLDTGKGGVKIIMSVPGWADGPYDFAKNHGPRKATTGSYTYGEAMFNAPVGESGVVVYQSMVMSATVRKPGDQPITAEHLAKEMLKANGFTTARAVKIDSPDTGLDGATVVAYKASGYSVFDGIERKKEKVALVVMSVALPDQKRGFAIMATVGEKDVAKFDTDPAKYEKAAMKFFAEIFKNSNWTLN